MAGRRDFAEETPRNLRKRIFVIYEGRETEKGYFDCFRNVYGLNDVFTYEKAPKERYDIDNTWRMQMKDLLHGFVVLHTRGRFTPFYFAKIILDAIFDENGLDPDSMSDGMRKDFYSVRIESSNEMLNKSNGIVSEGLVNSGKLGEAKNLVLKKAEYKLKKYQLRLSIPPDSIFIGNDSGSDFIEGTDHIFMVIDRDFDYTKDSPAGERTDESYEEIIKECEKKGIEVLLSNPDFEFWMLLHHERLNGEPIDYWDIGTGVGARDRVNDAMFAIEKEKTKTVLVFDKTERRKKLRLTKVVDLSRFRNYYEGKFDFAIANSKDLALELLGPNGLVRNAGSNVGIKLKELM